MAERSWSAGRWSFGQRPQPVSQRVHASLWWQMPVKGHMSCMVHTTRLPLCMMRRRSASESMAWLVQCRCMTSASRKAGWRVMSLPKRAVSTLHSPSRLKPLRSMISALSRANLALRHSVGLRASTPPSSPSGCVSRHSMRACTPRLWRARSRRRAAMAAPPVWLEVFTSNTLSGRCVAGGMPACEVGVPLDGGGVAG